MGSLHSDSSSKTADSTQPSSKVENVSNNDTTQNQMAIFKEELDRKFEEYQSQMNKKSEEHQNKIKKKFKKLQSQTDDLKAELDRKIEEVSEKNQALKTQNKALERQLAQLNLLTKARQRLNAYVSEEQILNALQVWGIKTALPQAKIRGRSNDFKCLLEFLTWLYVILVGDNVRAGNDGVNRITRQLDVVAERHIPILGLLVRYWPLKSAFSDSQVERIRSRGEQIHLESLFPILTEEKDEEKGPAKISLRDVFTMPFRWTAMLQALWLTPEDSDQTPDPTAYNPYLTREFNEYVTCVLELGSRTNCYVALKHLLIPRSDNAPRGSDSIVSAFKAYAELIASIVFSRQHFRRFKFHIAVRQPAENEPEVSMVRMESVRHMMLLPGTWAQIPDTSYIPRESLVHGMTAMGLPSIIVEDSPRQ